MGNFFLKNQAKSSPKINRKFSRATVPGPLAPGPKKTRPHGRESFT